MQVDRQVVPMILLLIAKLVKLGWFDDQLQVRNLVKEIKRITIESQHDSHRFIAIQALDQIIVEMTYITKKVNPSINRRISMSFRDNELRSIFENNLQFT